MRTTSPLRRRRAAVPAKVSAQVWFRTAEKAERASMPPTLTAVRIPNAFQKPRRRWRRLITNFYLSGNGSLQSIC